MVKDKANPFLKIFITLCLVLLASCRTLCQNPQYDNLSFGVPGKADIIIDPAPDMLLVTLNTMSNQRGLFT